MKLETIVRPDLSQLTSVFQQGSESASAIGGDQSISRASYMCRKCKVHGKLVPVKRHKRNCLYLHCKCIKCLLVDQGRKVVAKQIALYRDQRHVGADDRHSDSQDHRVASFKEYRLRGVVSVKNNSSDKDIGIGPHCRRCRNHNVTVIWKNHKKSCPYRHCPCDPCRLINVRKDTEKTLRDMQIVADESNCSSRSKNSYHTYPGYSQTAASSKSPNAVYNPMMEKSNFDLYPRSSISNYYNSSPSLLGPGINSTFQKLVSATCPGSTAGDLSHLANISSQFSNTDLFTSNSDIGANAPFKSLGGGFMMNNRNQHSYQSLDYHPEMWTYFNPTRSTAFSSYGMAPEYCNSTYSYLNSLGMTNHETSQTPLVPMAEHSDQDASSGSTMYRSFTDYCY